MTAVTVHVISEAEQLEALARERMAALVKARGWDSQRARDDEIAFIDAVLDAWNETQG